MDESHKEKPNGKKPNKGRLHPHKVHAPPVTLPVRTVVALGERHCEVVSGTLMGLGCSVS